MSLFELAASTGWLENAVIVKRDAAKSIRTRSPFYLNLNENLIIYSEWENLYRIIFNEMRKFVTDNL